MKIKAIYLIQESGCLNPQSGAFQHISVGFEQLSISYDMIAHLNHQSINLSDYKKTNQNPKEKGTKIRRVKQRGALYGTLKDLQLIFQYIINIPKLYKTLKTKEVNFIYERTAYFNFSGLIVAKLLGIPHFYEANGIQFKARQKYYKSLLSPAIRAIEKWMYKKSNHTFFVGTYGFYWKIKSNNWTNIENGVEKELLSFFSKKEKQISRPLNICFIARLMQHQRPDVLIEALLKLKDTNNLKLHLIGSGLEVIEEKLKGRITIINHGFQDRDNIKQILKDMHIGIIAGSPEYQSTMKIFDYGAAQCAVVAPNITNLKYWFGDEILFFKKNKPKELTLKLEKLLSNQNLIKKFGESLFIKIKNEFSWDNIFANVKSKINYKSNKKLV